MAATKSKPRRSSSLRAFTAAALALPGLIPAHAADGDDFSFEYHHYQESKRNLDGQSYRDLKLKPLEADSISLGLNGSVLDRIKFGLKYEQDTWSGATPVTTVPYAAIADQLFSGASRPTSYYTDAQHHPVVVNWSSYDGTNVQYKKDARLVHVMASASPETRRQIDAKFGYEWDEATLNLGGGVSDEPDYHSLFVNAGGRLDFNRKLTTLSWGASYTNSAIAASLAANSAADWGNYLDKIGDKGGVPTLFGTRNDISGSIGVTQILDKNSLVSASVNYTRGSGYLSNPYKATVLAFDDPGQFLDSTGLRLVVLKGVLEQRPTLRNQWTMGAQYVRYVEDTDAALHLDYRFYHDDWGINAHTLDVSWYQPLGAGWTIVPDVRYYTQTRAFFYKPYFLFNQAFPILLPRNPELPPQIDFSQLQVRNFSSDERLSGFGTVTGQLALSKLIFGNMCVEVGAEYSIHAGSLKLGGNGEHSYADFNSYTLYASLNLDLAGRASLDDPRGNEAGSDAGSARSGKLLSSVTPAGVEFTRLLDDVGDFAMSFRHEYGIRAGATLHGSRTVSDDTITALDCAGQPCTRKARGEYSHVTSIDLLYKPFDGVTLMVTPRLIDLHMDERDLGGGFFGLCCVGPGGGGAAPSLKHTTGGLGDTGVYALSRLWDAADSEIDAGLGLIVPTGSVNKRVNTGLDFLSYGLQTGSGTWDLNPSLTYVAEADRISWGAQISGVVRLQSRNGSGYALGDVGQATVWGSYRIMDWLFASVRGIAAVQGSVRGQFKGHVTPNQTGYNVVDGVPVPAYEYDLEPQTELGPADSPGSYGGSFGDIGIGIASVVPGGAFAGDRIALEWVQPVRDVVNGYQLRRTGTLSIRWDFTL